MPPQYSVLLVDDEESIHEAFAFALAEAGYLVGSAANGAIGFQMFLEGSWDAVVTDRAMPEMTGEQLAQEIKSVSPATPIILITGHLPNETGLQLFDEVLLKPFTMQSFVSCVDRIFSYGTNLGL